MSDICGATGIECIRKTLLYGLSQLKGAGEQE